MQLIAALIFIGLIVLILGGCMYLARRQKPKSQHYGTWSNVLGPRFGRSPLDVNEQLNEEISESRRAHRAQHTRRRQK
jgi:hypothetical protein